MTPMGMAAGAIGSMFSSPAAAQPITQTITSNSSMSFVNGQLVSSSDESFDSATAMSIGDFPITDKYGSTEGRSRPHGGVDVGIQMEDAGQLLLEDGFHIAQETTKRNRFDLIGLFSLLSGFLFLFIACILFFKRIINMYFQKLI